MALCFSQSLLLHGNNLNLPFAPQSQERVPSISSSSSSSSSSWSLKFPSIRIRCSSSLNDKSSRISITHKTCKNCKTQYDPSLNHPLACRFHTAHYGGETKRKFESVYEGGTMNTPDSGKVLQYWHCCGSEDPFDPGCTAAPHSSYDD